MNGFHGKYFSITDPEGVNTVIYRINETAKQLQNKYPRYTVERLVSSEEMQGNLTKRTYYVDYPEENGEDFDKFTKIFEIDCAITANTSDDKNEINDSLKSGKKNKCIIF